MVDVILLNIAGITSHFAELEILVSKKNPKIVMLTETHLTVDVEASEYNIRNYNMLCCYSTSRHTGGVIMYIHESVKYHVVDNSTCGLNWFMAIKVVKGLKVGVYGLLYHSPSVNDQELLLHLELNWLEKILDDKGMNLIAGDFNINWKHPNDSANLRNVMQCFNLDQKIKDITRRTIRSETIIDLVFCNENELNVTIDRENKISDHETIQIQFDDGSKPLENCLMIKCWKKYSKNALTSLLRNSLPNNSERQLDEKAEVLSVILKESVNKLVLVKNIKCSNRKKWYTLELKSLQVERDEAYKKASTSWEEADWQHYKVLRNEYSYSIKKAKSEYTQKKIEHSRGNSKQLWKTLKSLWKNKEKPAKSISFNGEVTDNDQEICEKFNSYFVDSVQQINDTIEDIQDCFANNDQFSGSWNMFHPISFETLCRAIDNIGSSSGIDNVNLQVLKDSLEVTGEYLLGIINDSLEQGNFPSSWKQSTVIPIPKVSGTLKAEEYRPINMLPIYEKVLEIIVKDQLLEYLNEQQILISEQSGFRQNHSCESALNLLLYKWKQMIEEKKTIIVLFLDLKRAFETISRPVLLQTLSKYGIGGCVLKWFASYLSSRTQVCQYGNSVSSAKPVPLGVPQGSVLGPILFILYINDMKKAIKHCDINLFADDTVIFIADKDENVAINKIREDIETLNKWLKIKKLKLNVQKTKSMIISNKKHINYTELKIDIEGVDIERVNVFKYLGVHIDEKLTFRAHIDYVIKKIARKYGLLVRLNSQLTFWSKIFLYKTLVAPHIDYCSSVLFLASETHLKRLQRLQNKFMRHILNCNRYTHTVNMLDALQWLSVKERIVFNVMTMIFKLTNNLLPEYLTNIIKRGRNIHSYRTRQIDDIRVASFTMTTTQKSVYYSGIRIFNELPMDIKNARTVSEFKRNCSIWIKNRYR